MNKKITNFLLMVLLFTFGTICYGATNYAARDSSGSCFSNFYYHAQNGTVYFTDTSIVSGPVIKRTWNFGDGSYSSLKNPTHTYAPGIYKANVCLNLKTATDSCVQCKLVSVRQADTCVADFSYTIVPLSSSHNNGYVFYDRSFGSTGITSRLWTLPGGITKTDTSFAIQFDTTLTQANVCLAINTSSGCQSSVCKTIVLKDTMVKKCAADFYTLTQNGTVSFIDSSKAGTYVTSWMWNFGDGTSSSLKNPQHTYASNVYNAYVCLTIGSSTGCTSSFCKLVSVRDSGSVNCIANFSYYVHNRTVSFTDSSRADTVLYRIWSFGDGSYGNGPNPSHTYTGNSQQYYVCLTVRTKTDSCTSCKYIYIPSSGDSCIADFTYTLLQDSSQTSKTYRFVDQSHNSSGTAWRIWALSDSAHSMDSVFVHTFDRSLTSANICLTVGTLSGCQATTCRTIILKDTVINGCVANFMFNVNNSLVSFTDSSSASTPIVGWQWNFGDSTFSTIKNPVHNFSSNLSVANVCLKISTSTGCQSSVCKTILLKDSVPVPTCKASFSYIRDSLSTMGNTYHFYNYSTSPDSLTYVWNFGDGTYSIMKDATHTYNSTSVKQFLVTLYINSHHGCFDSTFQFINIPTDSMGHVISGVVKGNQELLPSGIILLYKKGTKYYSLKGYQVVSGGLFRFEKLEKGSYILYAIPDIMYLSSYLPTYYVNKLSWTEADIINLTNDALGLTLQLQSTKIINRGIGKIKGTLINDQGIAATNNNMEKSSVAVSPSVILYTPSGVALCSSSPDINGNFEFQDLPLGNYSIKIEYPNLESKSQFVSLNNEIPEKDNLNFTITDNVTRINTVISDKDIAVLYLSSSQLSIRIKESGTYKVSLTSMSGAILIDTEINLNANEDNILSTVNISNGIYILKLQNNSGTWVKKVLR